MYTYIPCFLDFLPNCSSHLEKTPFLCFRPAVAFSFLCPAASCSYDKSPVQWHFLSEVFSDPQAELVTSPWVLPPSLGVSLSCELHVPLDAVSCLSPLFMWELCELCLHVLVPFEQCLKHPSLLINAYC